jgi:hypothetical protein
VTRSTSTSAPEAERFRIEADAYSRLAFEQGARLVGSMVPAGALVCAFMSAAARGFSQRVVTGAGTTAETSEVGATASPGAQRRLPPLADATGNPHRPGGAPQAVHKLRKRRSRA